MLSGFHVMEKIRVVDNACHVGLVKLDHAHDFELVRHEEILDLRYLIYDWKMRATDGGAVQMAYA